MRQVFPTLVFLSFLWVAYSSELTFELPDKRKDCFYETFESGEKAQLAFRVIAGGNNDVDVRLFGPNSEVIYQADKKQHGVHHFTVDSSGVFLVCFSNKFSTFTHKLVFFVLRSGRLEPEIEAATAGDAAELLTEPGSQRMVASMGAVGASLSAVRDYQTHFRLSAASDRIAAEGTGSTVMAWSVMETLAVVAVGVGQVVALRRLFAAKRGVRVAGAT